MKDSHISVSQIRGLKGVLEREKAEIGVFLTLKQPTRQMYRRYLEANKKIAYLSWWPQDTFEKSPRRQKNNPEEAQNNLLKELQES